MQNAELKFEIESMCLEVAPQRDRREDGVFFQQKKCVHRKAHAFNQIGAEKERWKSILWRKEKWMNKVIFLFQFHSAGL
jgi:hypothetical protein